MSKHFLKRKSMLGFVVFSVILIIFSSLLELSSQVTTTIILLTIIILIYMEFKIRVDKKS